MSNHKDQIKPEDQLKGKDVEISGSGWAVMEKTWERVQAKVLNLIELGGYIKNCHHKF